MLRATPLVSSYAEGLARSQGTRQTMGNGIESGVYPIPNRLTCADHVPPKNGASN